MSSSQPRSPEILSRFLGFALGVSVLVASCTVTDPESPAATSPDPAPITTSTTSLVLTPTTAATTTTTTTIATTTTLPLEERLTGTLDALRAIGPREAGTEAEEAAASYLAERLGRIPAHWDLEQVPLPNGLTSRNLWTTISDGPVHILLGAHYDSVRGSPGIDDNGSGVAVLLELAEQLASRPPEELTVTIVFFGAEEILHGHPRDDHHFGSRQMAARLAENDELPDWMLSVDMVGAGGAAHAVRFGDTDERAAELLVAAAEAIGVDIVLEARGDISDHEAFARAGVPAAFFWRPDNAAWHTSEDDHADLALLAEDLAVLEAFLELAGTRE